MANTTRPAETPAASEAVSRAIEAGATAVADGAAAVSWYRFRARPTDPGDYRTVDLRAGDRHVQISISPTGRRVHVFVDGTEVEA